MRSVLKKEFEGINLPPLPEVNFDEEVSSPIADTFDGSDIDLTEQISFLEKRRNTLISTISNLTQKVKSVRTEYNSQKEDLSGKISHVRTLITNLQDKKQIEQKNLSLIGAQQRKLAETLQSLDYEKSNILKHEALTKDQAETLKSKINDVSKKEQSLTKLNFALLEKEKRLMLKEKDIDLTLSNSVSKFSTLEQHSKELRIVSQDLDLKDSNLKNRENILAQKLSALKSSHIHFLKEKANFEQKNQDSLLHLRKITEKEIILQASVKSLSSRELELTTNIKKNSALLSHLRKREDKVTNLMSKFSSSKKILEENRKHHAALLKEAKSFEKDVSKSKEAKLKIESEILHLENTLASLNNDVKITAMKNHEDDRFIKAQKLDLENLNKELSSKQTDLKKKEVLLDRQKTELTQKQIRIDGLNTQVDEREKFFVKQQEELKKEEIRIQALLSKHAGLAEKIKELEIHERDMNLKILSFENREDALQSLEGSLKQREQDLMNKEANSDTLQLNSKITKLDKQIESITAEKEVLAKTISDLESKGTNSTNNLTELTANSDKLSLEIKKLKTENAKLKSDFETASISEEALKKETEQLHKSLYDVGSRNIQFIDKDDDVQKVLKITDDLLEHLPEDVLKKFVESEDFHIFEKVFKKYNIE